MKTVLRLVGALLIVVGVIWILQGLNVLLGSFMSSHIEWAYAGAGAAAVGIALLVVAQIRR